ncbi:MAG: hypothetical protein ACJA1D_001381 [Polaribacter sp.]|jgi:hypothetical protein
MKKRSLSLLAIFMLFISCNQEKKEVLIKKENPNFLKHLHIIFRITGSSSQN